MRKHIRLALLATLVLMMSLFAAGPAYAQDCVVSAGVIQFNTAIGPVVVGTEGPDTINCSGLSTGRIIDGRGGDDVIRGSTGNDAITGGAGNDTIRGMGGNDIIEGGDGADTILGGLGDDILSGPPDDGAVDTIDGGAGTDTCVSGGGDILSNCP